MKCEYCGRLAKVGDTMCSGCGAPLKIEEIMGGEGTTHTGSFRVENSFSKNNNQCLEDIVYAGFFRRLIALWIDWTCYCILLTFLSIVFVMLNASAIIILVSIVLGLGYFVAADCKEGTWGKRAMKICVVDEQGKSISFGISLLRHIILCITAGFWMVSVAMIIFGKEKQGIHDRLTKTYIIRR